MKTLSPEYKAALQAGRAEWAANPNKEKRKRRRKAKAPDPEPVFSLTDADALTISDSADHVWEFTAEQTLRLRKFLARIGEPESGGA